METFLLDLIQRIIDKSDHHIKDSSKTRSWNALREAEKITEKKYIPFLEEYLTKEPDKEKRKAAYFILCKIAKNILDETVAEFVLHELKKEKDKYIISSTLDLVGYIPKSENTDLSFIFECMKNKEWLIRHSAIRALKNTKNKNVEQVLLENLENSTDSLDITYLNSTLSYIGTKKAIPYLEKCLMSKKRDVKGSAKFAIEAIEKRLS